MGFLRVRNEKETWIILFRQRLNDLIRTDSDNALKKANRKIISDGVFIEGAMDVEKKISSRKRREVEPSPSTAEITLWQMLLRN